MKTPHEEIISLGNRYLSGDVQKRMLSKYTECIINCAEYEMSNLHGFYKIGYAINFAVAIIQHDRIIKAPILRFKKGGVLFGGTKINHERGDELIINKNDKITKLTL